MDDRIRNEGSPDTTERMPPTGETPSIPSMPPLPPPPPSYGGSIPPPPPPSYGGSTTPPPSGTPGWSGPVSAQPGWMPPAAGYNAYAVPKANVTGLARIGALWLVLMGVLWTAIGVGIAALGTAGATAVTDLDPSLRPYIGSLISVFVALGVVIAVLAVIEVLVGIFAWRGAGFARFLGSVYAWFFGLILVLGSLGGNNSTTSGASNTTTSTLIALAIGIGYLFTALVFAFRWKSRPGS